MALLTHLGISLKDAHGHAKNAADVLPELAEAFKHTTDATMQARMAAELFGARLGKTLLPLLQEGSDGLADLTEQASRLRYAVTPEGAEGLEHYHRSMIGLTTAVGGFTTELAAKLAPALDPIVEGTRDWVIANRDWITQDISERVDALVKALGTVDWAGWATEAHRIGDAMEWVHDQIGDVGIAIAGVTALMWSNPWLAAVGGLILAAQEIYDHWGPIKDFFADLWAGITAAFDAAWEKIKPIVDAMRDAVNWIGSHVAGGGGGQSVTGSISTYIDEHTHLRTLPGSRTSSDRHDAEEGGNRHVVTNWISDVFARPGDGSDSYAGWNAPALSAPPAILSVPSAVLATQSAAQQGPAPQMEMRVVFDNAPDGMRVSTTGNSTAPLPIIDVGHAMPSFGH